MTKPNLYVFLTFVALLIAGVVLYAMGKDAAGGLLLGGALGALGGNVAPSGEPLTGK